MYFYLITSVSIFLCALKYLFYFYKKSKISFLELCDVQWQKNELSYLKQKVNQ